MKITLNGNPKVIPSDTTIGELLGTLQIPPDTVVVELNTIIIQPESYDGTTLSADDRLELIRFVGGG